MSFFVTEQDPAEGQDVLVRLAIFLDGSQNVSIEPQSTTYKCRIFDLCRADLTPVASGQPERQNTISLEYRTTEYLSIQLRSGLPMIAEVHKWEVSTTDRDEFLHNIQDVDGLLIVQDVGKGAAIEDDGRDLPSRITEFLAYFAEANNVVPSDISPEAFPIPVSIITAALSGEVDTRARRKIEKLLKKMPWTYSFVQDLGPSHEVEVALNLMSLLRQISERGPDRPRLIAGHPYTDYPPTSEDYPTSPPARVFSPAMPETPANQTRARKTDETPPDSRNLVTPNQGLDPLSNFVISSPAFIAYPDSPTPASNARPVAASVRRKGSPKPTSRGLTGDSDSLPPLPNSSFAGNPAPASSRSMKPPQRTLDHNTPSELGKITPGPELRDSSAFRRISANPTSNDQARPQFRSSMTAYPSEPPSAFILPSRPAPAPPTTPGSLQQQQQGIVFPRSSSMPLLSEATPAFRPRRPSTPLDFDSPKIAKSKVGTSTDGEAPNVPLKSTSASTSAVTPAATETPSRADMTTENRDGYFAGWSGKPKSVKKGKGKGKGKTPPADESRIFAFNISDPIPTPNLPPTPARKASNPFIETLTRTPGQTPKRQAVDQGIDLPFITYTPPVPAPATDPDTGLGYIPYVPPSPVPIAIIAPTPTAARPRRAHRTSPHLPGQSQDNSALRTVSPNPAENMPQWSNDTSLHSNDGPQAEARTAMSPRALARFDSPVVGIGEREARDGAKKKDGRGCRCVMM